MDLCIFVRHFLLLLKYTAKFFFSAVFIFCKFKYVFEIFSGRFIIEYVGEVIDADEMIRRGRRLLLQLIVCYFTKEKLF